MFVGIPTGEQEGGGREGRTELGEDKVWRIGRRREGKSLGKRLKESRK